MQTRGYADADKDTDTDRIRTKNNIIILTGILKVHFTPCWSAINCYMLANSIDID